MVFVGRDSKEDVLIKIEKAEGEENIIEIESSVKNLFGKHIKELILENLKKVEIPPLKVEVKDNGALDFVILARLEAGIKRLFPNLKFKFLPEKNFEYRIQSAKERTRRSRLYIPGNQPDLMINAYLFKPDGIILDLEDSVAPSEKGPALILTRNALMVLDFGEAERMVRINQLPKGLFDLPEILETDGIDCILIPKAERGEDIAQVSQFIKEYLNKIGIIRKIWLMPIIESALGALKAYEIASSCPEVCAIAFGAEDFTKDIGAQRTREGRESFVARSLIVLGARAAGVQPIDTVFADVEDLEGLYNSVKEAQALGFEGKGSIHPRQIEIIHKGFKPTEEEFLWACKVKKAYEEAKEKGLGVVSLGTKMIDPPVVERALKVIKLGKIYGMEEV